MPSVAFEAVEVVGLSAARIRRMNVVKVHHPQCLRSPSLKTDQNILKLSTVQNSVRFLVLSTNVVFQVSVMKGPVLLSCSGKAS